MKNLFPSTPMGWVILVILISAYVILIIETFKRKRNLKSQSFFSYLLWSVLDVLALVMALEEESYSLMLIFGCIFFSSFMALSLIKYDKEKKWTKEETRTSVIIFVVILFWMCSRSNSLGFILVVFAEATAGWPQMKKSWKYPGSRLILISYVLFFIFYVLSIFDAPNWKSENVLFPIIFSIYCIGDTLPLIIKWLKIEKRYRTIKINSN